VKIANKYILLAQFSFICLALGGCFYHESAEQRQWWQRQSTVNGMIACCDGNLAPFLMRTQIISVLRKPDLIFKPRELERNLPGDVAYKKKVMNDIWKAYRIAKRHNNSFNCIDVPNFWESCDDFLNCLLFIYDESMHFKKPSPQCIKVGFTCYIYIIENEKVIAYTPSAFWEPLVINGSSKKENKGKTDN